GGGRSTSGSTGGSGSTSGASSSGAGSSSGSSSGTGASSGGGPGVGPLEPLTPVPVPRGQEVGNPFPGALLRYEQSAVGMEPPGWPMMDAYTRVYWKDLETSEGQYDFSSIAQGLAYAKQHGGKFGFRVMAADSGRSGAQVPAYLVGLMPNG